MDPGELAARRAKPAAENKGSILIVAAMGKRASETRLNLARGKRLGKYRLEKCLGEGGSCEVWKAKDCVEG
ncbi:MAG: hypothetical protein ACYSUP_17145, partial [Planctomycetota bacterium]